MWNGHFGKFITGDLIPHFFIEANRIFPGMHGEYLIATVPGNILRKIQNGTTHAFTPNGDGRNDLAKAIPVGIREFRYFAIYNRWGETIFTTKDPSKGWDGRVAGVLQDNAVFVWMAQGVDFKGNLISKKGTITLIK